MSNEHNKAHAVPQGLQWFTVAEHGIPEIGAEVIGGFWYTDPWLKSEFATTFMWGQCRVLENKGRDFKDGKQWHTFGPSHNQITHWARINNPGEVATPATAPSQPVTLTDRQFDLICQAIDKADTITMEGEYMLDSDDCIGVVRVMQALFSIAALREKEQA